MPRGRRSASVWLGIYMRYCTRNCENHAAHLLVEHGKRGAFRSRLNEVIRPPLPHTGAFQEIATTIKTALTAEMQRSQARLDQVRHGSLVHETIGHMVGLVAYCGTLSELINQRHSNLSTDYTW